MLIALMFLVLLGVCGLWYNARYWRRSANEWRVIAQEYKAAADGAIRAAHELEQRLVITSRRL